MSQRVASTVSIILNLLLFAVFGMLAFIFEIIVLNGVSESQGARALGISLACLGAWAILLGMLSWNATALLIDRFRLNPAPAILLTLILGMLCSGVISFLAILASILPAGIR
ncbi:MAG: hypothetical protein ACM3XO_01000 [Bacteroidota bacterium]